MDLHFVDPSEAPVPPDEVQIRAIRVQPERGGELLNVQIDLTPFQQRPSLELEVFDREQRLVAEASVIEVDHPSMEFNLHLRAANGAGEHRLRVEVGYPEQEPVDVKDVTFDVRRSD